MKFRGREDDDRSDRDRPLPQKKEPQEPPPPPPPHDDDDNDNVVHPMVPVPDAIRIVLNEASRIVVAGTSVTPAAARGGGDGYTLEEDESPWGVVESLKLYDDDEDDKKEGSSAARGGKYRLPRTSTRTVAREIAMPSPGYPPYRASVMDGYAISRSQSLGPKNNGGGGGDSGRGSGAPNASTHPLFRVIRKVHAGDSNPPPPPHAEGESTTTTVDADESRSTLPIAYYVTTGAIVPDSCDCVVPIEDVRVTTDVDGATIIELLDTADVRPGRWIRAIGFDLPTGTVVAHAGQALDSTTTGLLRQAGCTTVDVLPLIRVGILSTGNELVDDPHWFPHQSSKGIIPDVNRPALMALYSSWNNCEVIDLGIVKDSDDDAIRNVLLSALDTHQCKVIVTTGGISMGEMDRMEAVLTSLQATVHLGRLHMKPGKPTTFATLPNNRMGFCLPGNPVSAVVCSHLLVRPCLDLLHQAPLILLQEHRQKHDKGSKDPSTQSTEDLQRKLIDELPLLHPEVPVLMMNDVVLDVERPEYHRVRLRPVVDAASGAVRLEAHSTGVQQSSRLASMMNAHAVVWLPQASPDLPKVTKGTLKRALLLGDSGGIFPRLRLSESLHMKEGSSRDEATAPTSESLALPDADAAARKRPLSVELVLVRCAKPSETDSLPPDVSEATRQVEQALGAGPHSSFRVVNSRAHRYRCDGFAPQTVWEEAILGSGATRAESDILIVAYEGPMVQQLQLATYLKSNLSKLAPALEMDARQGIATESTTSAALFDVVVGVVTDPPRKGRLFLLLPVAGLMGALSSTRRQVRHAVKVSQQPD